MTMFLTPASSGVFLRAPRVHRRTPRENRLPNGFPTTISSLVIPPRLLSILDLTCFWAAETFSCAHLCHLPSPSQQMGSSPSQVLPLLNITLAVRQAIDIQHKRVQRMGKETAVLRVVHSLWEIKDGTTKAARVTESVQHEAFGEHSNLQGPAVESRASIVQLLYSLFGGVRVP